MVTVEGCNTCSISGNYCHPESDPCPAGEGTCEIATDYDAFLDAFEGGCPAILLNQLDCDDESCQTSAVGGPGWIEFQVTSGQDYLLRLGGWYGTGGSDTYEGFGQFTVTFTEIDSTHRPDIVEWTSSGGTVGGSCNTDADCCGSPVGTCEGYCVPQEDGSFPGSCYGPQHRYLSVNNDATVQEGATTAMRVSLQGGGAGPWFVGEPRTNLGKVVADLQAAPYYSNAWPSEVNIIGCPIAPAIPTSCRRLPRVRIPVTKATTPWHSRSAPRRSGVARSRPASVATACRRT